MAYKNDNDRMLKIPMYDPRAQPLPVEPVGVFDGPTVTICINQDWARKHVVNVLYRLAWVDAWTGTDEEVATAVSEANRLISVLSTSSSNCATTGDNLLLRQNPTDPCLLEQSTDGGLTWSTAFDYVLCQSSGLDATTSIADLEAQLAALIASFNALSGDIAQLYPNLVYDMTSEDDIRDLALCAATDAIVDFICELVLKERENQATIARIGAIILSITSAALTVSGIGSPVGLAIAAVLVEGYASIWDGVSETILGDEVAKDLVACCMYNTLKGTTISQTAFEQSLDNCNFTPLSPEAQIAGAIVGMLSDDDFYIAFIDFLDEKIRPAELGLVSCNCAAPTQTFYLECDFTAGDGGFTPAAAGQAQYSSGEGWREVDDGSVSRCYINYTFLSPVHVTDLEYRFTKSPATGTGLRDINYFFTGGQQDKLTISGAAFPYPSVFTHTRNTPDCTQFQLRVNSSGGASYINMDRARMTIEAEQIPGELTANGWTEYTP